MANGKIQPFTNLDQSKHHCYTLSTTCTLFKLASEVGPCTKYLMNYSMNFAKICVILMLSLSSKCEGTQQVR